MDISQYVNIAVVIILVGSGRALKSLNKIINKDNSYIPFILYALGAILGFILNRSLEGVASGFVCGMLAVSVHQTGKQSISLIKQGKFFDVLLSIFTDSSSTDSNEKEDDNKEDV